MSHLSTGAGCIAEKFDSFVDIAVPRPRRKAIVVEIPLLLVLLALIMCCRIEIMNEWHLERERKECPSRGIERGRRAQRLSQYVFCRNPLQIGQANSAGSFRHQ